MHINHTNILLLLLDWNVVQCYFIPPLSHYQYYCCVGGNAADIVAYDPLLSCTSCCCVQADLTVHESAVLHMSHLAIYDIVVAYELMLPMILRTIRRCTIPAVVVVYKLLILLRIS